MATLLPGSTIFSYRCNKRSTVFNPTITSAKKNNLSEDENNNPQFPTFLAQSASVLFALGFIDAGYSGDWSRIGVVSKETEGLLKVAAFLVVPFCFFLVLWLSNKSKEVS